MLETICDILKDSYARNWITSRDGNISIRHHDRDHFYITPSGVRKQTLQPDQFKKIGLVNTGTETICRFYPILLSPASCNQAVNYRCTLVY